MPTPLSRRHLLIASAAAAIFARPAFAQPLSGPALVTALRGGGYVLLMRHAASPRTVPEPANPDNTKRERQLDETGRATAKAMGESLTRLRIPVGDVLSSPTYRALETVKLAGFAGARTFPELGSLPLRIAWSLK